MKLKHFEEQYLNLLQKILDEGEYRADRTGTGTKAIFGEQIKIDLSEGFPILNTKKVPFKSVLSELLWFVEGSSDERRLAEILHGTRDKYKLIETIIDGEPVQIKKELNTIWSPNAEGTTGAKYQPEYYGDLGRVYGVQWRHWKTYKPLDQQTIGYGRFATGEVDQLAEVIHKLKNNPTDRRIILSAWNPGELDQMALPPCHMFAQFYVSNDKKLSCMMTQRSVDTFLGLPFNIVSYSILTQMLADICNLQLGNLTINMGDTHIYMDHIDQVKEQLSRTPSKEAAILCIKRTVKDIDDFKMEDFELLNYNPQPAIKAKMSA